MSLPARAAAPPPRRRGGGYSLVEVVVSLTVFIAILLGVLFIFHLNYRLARGRGDTAERQEELRGARHEVERLARLALRGGLPGELAIEIDRDVGPGTRIGGPDSPRVAAGSDILTVRGVFSTPLFRVGPADGSLRLGAGGGAAAGEIEIRDPSPQTGVAQSLAELAATIEARRPATVALLMASQLDESIFAVVDSDTGTALVSRDGDRVARITLRFEAGGAAADLGGAGPAAALRGAAFVGILEEYRFYVREAFSVPGDETSTPRSQLSVARLVPGTDEPWGGDDAALAVDLADDVEGLEVTVDRDGDGDDRVVIDLEGL